MSAALILPDLVIQKIIGIAAEPFLDCLSSWKNALPLLAVCSAWRHAAKPIVYSKVYIESMRTNDLALRPIHQSHLLDDVLGSNIDLVASVGSTQLVKHIDINIKYLGCMRAFVCGGSLEHFLRANSWPGVSSLSVIMSIIPYDTNDSDSIYTEKLFEDQQSFCNAMAKRMPSIVDVSVKLLYWPQCSVSFGKLIVKTYLQQLGSLKCSAKLLDGIAELPSQITSLSITLVSDELVKPPKLDVSMLERLEIYNAPFSFNLASLIDSEKGKIVEFPSLVNLTLGYGTYHRDSLLNVGSGVASAGDDTCGPKVLFPRLEELVLFTTDNKLVEELLLSDQYSWENVSSLALLSDSLDFLRDDDENGNSEYGQPDHYFDDYNEDDDDEEPSSRFYLSTLLQNMPRVSKLLYHVPSYFWAEDTVKNRLDGCTADRLAHIDIGPRTVLDFPQFSKDLVSLRIKLMDKSLLQLPYLNIRALQHLQLNDVPFNRFWQLFESSSTDEALFFDNLVSLKIRFCEEEVSSIDGLEELSRSSSSSSNSNSLIVHCPRLQDILINGTHVCGLWSVFSNEQSVWSNASRLCIRAKYCNMVNMSGNSEVGADETSRIMQFIDAVNQRIVCQLPNISDFEANPIMKSNGFDYPFSPLIRAYSSQLKRLVCKQPLNLDGCSFSDRLHTLDIELNGISIPGLPTTDTNTLETFKVQSIPSNFLWSWFKTGAYLDGIRFGGLSYINISIEDIGQKVKTDADVSLSSNVADVENSRLSVYMPRVHDFYVTVGPQGLKDWSADIHMNSVTTISLTGPFSSISAISRGMDFNSVERYYFDIESMDIEDEGQFYSVTNRAFSELNIYSLSSLQLPSMPFDIRVGDVNWIYLNNLSCVDIPFNTLTRLLPKLISLRFLDYEFAPDCMPELTGNVVLSTSIKSIKIDIYLKDNDGHFEPRSDEKDKMAFACAAFLVALIPSLCDANIYGYSYVSEMLSDIIEQYKDEFPHLSRLLN